METGVAFDEADGDGHVILQEGAESPRMVAGTTKLFEGFGVHEDEVIAVCIGVGVVPVFGGQAFHGVGGAPAFIGFIARFQVTHFHLDEGAAFAWGDDLLLQHCPAIAFVLDDLSGADEVSLLLHGMCSCRLKT